MSTYVLVHGSWHGSWSWEQVVPFLEQQGHTVRTLDLPGYDTDRTPWTDISFQDYVDRVCRVLDTQSEPVILVGHSRGGVVITQAAEDRPDKIAALVYLCAFLPRNGESLIQLAQQDSETLIFPHLTFAEDLGYIAVKDEGLAAYKQVFCADCSDEDAKRALARLQPDAFAANVTPVHTTDARFGRIPRIYIQTLRDCTVGPALQRQMYLASPCQQVITMDTGHSPFSSAPKELASHLASLAQVEAV